MCVVAVVACCIGVPPVWGSLADVLREPKFDHLGIAPIAPVLADTVASTYPVATASSGVVYVYNPAVDLFERQVGVAGPIIGERAETIGKGQLNVAASYSYVHFTSINGDDLDNLVNRPIVNGRMLVFPVRGGVTLANGRFSNFLPVRVVADIDLRTHIVAPSVTYGVTNDFDVNVTLPLLYTALDVTADTRVPDPRLPAFAVPPGDPNAQAASRSASGDDVGVGDLLLRAKWVLLRTDLVDVASQLGLSLPTGDRDDFRGTGAVQVRPTLVLSHVYGPFEPLVNVDVALNANDVTRSIVEWAAGGTAQLAERLSMSVVFLGRHELASLADPIRTPFFFQIERSDQYSASVGWRWRFAESGFVSANVIVPMNDEGIRATAIPTLEAEYAF